MVPTATTTSLPGAQKLESLPIWEDYMPEISQEIKDLTRILAQTLESGTLKKKKKRAVSSSESDHQSDTEPPPPPLKKNKKPVVGVPPKPISQISVKPISKKAALPVPAKPKPARKPTQAQKKKTIVGLVKRLTEALEEAL